MPAERATGFVTAQFVVAVAFSMLFFVLLANLVLVQYARGVVRAAVDEGARAGSRATASLDTCEAAAEDVRANLLGGSMGAGVSIDCALAGGGTLVQATATGSFQSWLPGIPNFPAGASATAIKEDLP